MNINPVSPSTDERYVIDENLNVYYLSKDKKRQIKKRQWQRIPVNQLTFQVEIIGPYFICNKDVIYQEVGGKLMIHYLGSQREATVHLIQCDRANGVLIDQYYLINPSRIEEVSCSNSYTIPRDGCYQIYIEYQVECPLKDPNEAILTLERGGRELRKIYPDRIEIHNSVLSGTFIVHKDYDTFQMLLSGSEGDQISVSTSKNLSNVRIFIEAK